MRGHVYTPTKFICKNIGGQTQLMGHTAGWSLLCENGGEALLPFGIDFCIKKKIFFF